MVEFENEGILSTKLRSLLSLLHFARTLMKLGSLNLKENFFIKFQANSIKSDFISIYQS